MKKIIIVAFTLAIAGCSYATKDQLAKVEAKADNAVLQSVEGIKASARALDAANKAQATADNAISSRQCSCHRYLFFQ